MPRIKSLLNGEVSNVRGDIARELVRMGVAEPIDSLEEVQQARLPKPGPIKPLQVNWSIEYVSSGIVVSSAAPAIKWLAIRRDTVRGNMTDTSYCLLPPNVVHDRTNHNGDPFCSAFGVAVPKEILDEYRQLWKSNPQSRAPFSGKVKAHPDAKSDKAGISTALGDATARGVLEGQLQLDKR
jgi:hypothetical protein